MESKNLPSPWADTTVKQGDNALSSIRLSVITFITELTI